MKNFKTIIFLLDVNDSAALYLKFKVMNPDITYYPAIMSIKMKY